MNASLVFGQSTNIRYLSANKDYDVMFSFLEGSVSMEKEIQKVQRRLEKKRGEVEAMEKKVNNPKAPEHVRAKFRTKVTFFFVCEPTHVNKSCFCPVKRTISPFFFQQKQLSLNLQLFF